YCENIPIAWLNASPAQNYITAVTYNRQCCEVWTSWSLDISCSNTTNHTVVTNNSGGVSLYSHAGGGNPPPNDGGGNPWYNPLWANPHPAVYFKDPIFTDTGSSWGKTIYDPVTGARLASSSYSTGGGANGNETLYWRQGFTLSNTVTVLGPPAFLISKSANPTSGITSGQPVTYVVNVCNTGQAMAGPVTVIDVHSTLMSLNQVLSFPFNSGPPDGQYSSGSGATTFVYLKGFPGGGACQPITYVMEDYYISPSDYC